MLMVFIMCNFGKHRLTDECYILCRDKLLDDDLKIDSLPLTVLDYGACL